MSTTILVTGATDGLGRAVAERLARDGASVLLHGRDPERLEKAAQEVGALGTVVADLADLSQVTTMAASVRERVGHLDVLVNNAGVGAGEPDGRTRRTSADGHELRLAVNHLAGFALILELLGTLRASAPSRIVQVASAGQQALDFDDLMLERDYSGGRAYNQSKLAQIMVAFELAARLGPGDGDTKRSGAAAPEAEHGVTATALHPGTLMPTKMVMLERGSSVEALDVGIDSTARLALDPALNGVTGVYFDRQRAARPHAQALDPAARATLWERSVELVRPHLSAEATLP